MIVTPSVRDLGGFSVRRILPSLQRRSVGPFVFFDEMGPLRLKTGLELEVRPHPHIGLATLTWLFEGGLMHRDSLGSVQVVKPGEVNLMTAGRGIVHSERASQAGLVPGAPMHGAQFWLGLPASEEECAPAFAHHPARDIRGGVVIGEHDGIRSPVAFPHPALCLDIALAAGESRRFELDDRYPERAVYPVSGELAVESGGQHHTLHAHTMLVLPDRAPFTLHAAQAVRLLIVGGAPLDGPRHLDWNFVSSRRERLAQARDDWRAGRFDKVPGETESIPYP